MNTFQLLAIPLCFGLAVLAMFRRRGVLSRRQTLFWVFLWISAGIVVALPDIADLIAHAFGIGRGADMVLYSLCFASILLVRYFYLRQRRLEITLTQIIRHHAIETAKRREAQT